MGWLSHPGAALPQPVLTGSLQTGVGRPSHDRLTSLVPVLQQSMGHPPSACGCVPCSFSGLFYYCFAIAILLWVLYAIRSLPLPALPASHRCEMSLSPGRPPSLSDATFGPWLLTGARAKASNLQHQARSSNKKAVNNKIAFKMPAASTSTCLVENSRTPPLSVREKVYP